MTNTWHKLLGSLAAALVLMATPANGGTEEEAQKWLDETEGPFNKVCHESILTAWEAGCNITAETQKALEKQSGIFGKFNADMQRQVLTKFPNWREFKNKQLRRALKYLSIGGTANMSAESVQKMAKIQSEMSTGYSLATVCEYNNASNCKLNLKDIEKKLATVKDTKELEHYWTAWHDKMSEVVSPDFYKEFVELLTEFSNANGFKFYSETVLAMYDEEREGWSYIEFERMLCRLADEISSLYDIIHAYVRMKLRKRPEYSGMIEPCGYLPVHITGNMWAQEWSALDSITKPFPDAPALDATAAMREQGYTPLRMFQESDKFYRELGLKGMSQDFWKHSILERPTDGRQMSCHATAWDMCLGAGNTDFRIRQCAQVTQQEFVIIHHEMGHVEYFQQYSDLAFTFRSSANPGFHEAIGDSLALAVTTPKHLQCKLNLDLGLPKSFCEQDKGPFNITETDINYLYYMGLQKLVFFPFAEAMDTWRWWAWEGKIPKDDYNKMWWRIRQDFQGISIPGDRSSSKLFDPAAKFHIVTNVDYLRYIVSHILQFQLYEAMCVAAKEFDPNDPNSKPLFQCDFAGSKEAGKLIGDMMKMGFSAGWPDALEAMTGNRMISIKPLKHYLQPVLDYMEKELKANGETIGFGDSCDEVKKRNGASKWSQLIPPEFWTASEKI